MNIFLIHAMNASIDPIEFAFRRQWSEAKLEHLVDETIAEDLSRSGRLDRSLHSRLGSLAEHAVGKHADGLLFTCSAFGPCIDELRRSLHPLPVRKPTEGMVAHLAKQDASVALVATYRPTLDFLPLEIPPHVKLQPVFVPGALEALERGDPGEHDRLIADRAAEVDASIIALAQFSASRAAPAVAQRTGKTVLTTPDAAALDLRQAVGTAVDTPTFPPPAG